MIYQLLGFSLFLLGCLHLWRPLILPETKLVENLQALFSCEIGRASFQEVWFLGRSTFVIISLVFLTSLNWKLGATAGVVFILIVGLEGLMKVLFNRARPFSRSGTIAMLQPKEPTDPGFPSGDTLRIWYLALTLTAAAGNSPWPLLASILLAIWVSLGRMVLGVHYLTDVLAGAGLGLLGAGTTIWLWNYFGLL